MTTDIELAQSLKRRATSANEFGESLYVKADDVLSLVEALEKAQGMEAYWKTQCRGITDHCEELQARNAELEQEKVALESVAMALRDDMRESRTVTVKLPDLRQIVSGDRYVWSDGVYNYSQDVKAILADAGIKVEAE